MNSRSIIFLMSVSDVASVAIADMTCLAIREANPGIQFLPMEHHSSC